MDNKDSIKSLFQKLLAKLISQALPALAVAGLYIVWNKAVNLYDDLNTMVKQHAELELKLQEMNDLKNELDDFRLMFNLKPEINRNPEQSPLEWNETQVRDYIEQKKK